MPVRGPVTHVRRSVVSCPALQGKPGFARHGRCTRYKRHKSSSGTVRAYMRGGRPVAFGVCVNRYGAGPGADDQLARGCRCTTRHGHTLPGKTEHQGQQDGEEGTDQMSHTHCISGHQTVLLCQNDANPARAGQGSQNSDCSRIS